MGSKRLYQSGANVTDIGTCCMCVPLRFGVALICMINLTYGFISLANVFTRDIRFQSGGYDPSPARLQVWYGAFMIPISLVGLLGLYDEKLSLLRAFGVALIFKAAIALVIFGFDMWMLTQCDSFASSHQQTLRSMQAMRMISQKGLCMEARVSYVFGFILDCGFTLYCTWAVFRCCRRVEECPPGVIRFKDTPDAEDPPELFDDRMSLPHRHHAKDPYSEALNLMKNPLYGSETSLSSASSVSSYGTTGGGRNRPYGINTASGTPVPVKHPITL
mmetsp:Transcript_27514/g.50413  ORF Transcript_27514/g.50413 Transcript_27514/m.50413 type:complete len:275 (+) Transcript_27514:84-908(+)